MKKATVALLAALLALTSCKPLLWIIIPPTATPTPSLTPTITATPTVTATATITPSPTPTATPTPFVVWGRPPGSSRPTRIIYALGGELPGDQWFRRTAWAGDLEFFHQGGRVLLAGSEDGNATIFVDDAVRLTIVRPDGSTRIFQYDASLDCQYHLRKVGPFDLTEYFLPGSNVVQTEILDQCYSAWGTKGLWLVEFQ